MDWKTLINAERERPSRTPEQPGSRSPFDRDYDRAVFSTPVRRLQDKTQVFPLDPNDSVRTRLTHSLEVSTAARGLTRHIVYLLEHERKLKLNLADVESIAATVSLIHDLGNPPFGHAGEQAIADWFSTKNSLKKLPAKYRNDLIKFEGNAQTLRIITKLQILGEAKGLNLTFGTLSACMKYTADASTADADHKHHEATKNGFFTSELPELNRIRKETGTRNSRNPIAFITEACDDAVYSTVDLEDGVRKGVISWANLKALLTEDSDPNIADAIKFAESNGGNRDEDIAQMFRVRMITNTLNACARAFVDNYDEIMNGKLHTELIKVSSAAKGVKLCKSAGRRKVYNSAETLKLELLGRTLMHDLMDVFWEGAAAYEGQALQTKSFAGKIYGLLSHNYRTAFETAWHKTKLPRDYLRAQLIADYVCGMTDSFAVQLHRSLLG